MSNTPIFQLQLAHLLWRYPPLVILPLAILGNSLSFIILSRRSISNSSVSAYLRIIAIADSITVITGYLPSVLREWTDIDIELLHDYACIIRRFVMFSAADTAVWLIVALSIDRMIIVVLPLRGKSWCRKRHAVIIAIGLLLLSFVKNFAAFFTLGVVGVNNATSSCAARSEYIFYEKLIRPWISLIMFYIIPATVIIVCNCLIVRKVLRATRKRAELSADMAGKQKAPTAGNNSLTRMMIAVTLLFLCLITPTMIIWTAVGQWVIKTEEDLGSVLLFFACTDILTFLNHSMNFPLYVLSGRRFRRELINLVLSGLFCREGTRDRGMSLRSSENDK